ncbi:MAG: hypothetical protein ACE5HU_06270 [Acidobacteriota bacterium]
MSRPTNIIIRVDPKTPNGLRAALIARYGIRWQKALIKKTGIRCNPSLISNVVAGRYKSRRVEIVIARALDLEPEDIWTRAA